MKLISTLPKRHFAELKSLADGIYEYTANGNYEISLYLDNLFYVITSSYNLIATASLKEKKPVGIWKGGKAVLLAYKNLGALIAYHHKMRRGREFSTEQKEGMILLGFRSLDELRRIKPAMLITSTYTSCVLRY